MSAHQMNRQRRRIQNPGRVALLYTGGTTGMRAHAGGYVSAHGYLADQLAFMPEFRSEFIPGFDVFEYDPLIDSANVEPSDWLTIARDIAMRYDEYDGFVVLHGPDTLAFTASALAFLLPGLRKPVVVTGSRIPLCEARNDARENIIASLMVASQPDLPEVCLCYGERVLRGCRAAGISTGGPDSFDSPNFPHLGRAGITVQLDTRLRRTVPADTELLAPITRSPHVASLRLFPGITDELVRNVLQPPLQGLILETYGAGSGLDRDSPIYEAIRLATDQGIVVVASTQCQYGSVQIGEHEAGISLASAGVINGADMTPEAALTKLTILLGWGLSPEIVRERMQQNLAGELTLPDLAA